MSQRITQSLCEEPRQFFKLLAFLPGLYGTVPARRRESSAVKNALASHNPGKLCFLLYFESCEENAKDRDPQIDRGWLSLYFFVTE